MKGYFTIATPSATTAPECGQNEVWGLYSDTGLTTPFNDPQFVVGVDMSITVVTTDHRTATTAYFGVTTIGNVKKYKTIVFTIAEYDCTSETVTSKYPNGFAIASVHASARSYAAVYWNKDKLFTTSHVLCPLGTFTLEDFANEA